MKEIVNRLQENRQIELAKSILEGHGYDVKKMHEEQSPDNASNSGCLAYPSDRVGDDIVLKLGDTYPIILSFRVQEQERGEKLYAGLVKSLQSSVADAVDYCMSNGFSISYNSTHLY